MQFHYSTFIESTPEEVFSFHERDDVLERLNPPWQPVEVVRRTGGLEVGAEVEFLIPAGPFRLRWLARHTAYEKNRLFADEQVSGPFRYWRHEHRFLPKDDGCILEEAVEFGLKGGPVADWLFGWAAILQFRKLFAYRHKVTKDFCEGRAS
jgi:ligand-binding SRPBCC domain-containing protein